MTGSLGREHMTWPLSQDWLLCLWCGSIVSDILSDQSKFSRYQADINRYPGHWSSHKIFWSFLFWRDFSWMVVTVNVCWFADLYFKSGASVFISGMVVWSHDLLSGPRLTNQNVHTLASQMSPDVPTLNVRQNYVKQFQHREKLKLSIFNFLLPDQKHMKTHLYLPVMVQTKLVPWMWQCW